MVEEVNIIHTIFSFINFRRFFFLINVTIQDESQTSCVQILTLPLNSCENLGKVLKVSLS